MSSPSARGYGPSERPGHGRCAGQGGARRPHGAPGRDWKSRGRSGHPLGRTRRIVRSGLQCARVLPRRRIAERGPARLRLRPGPSHRPGRPHLHVGLEAARLGPGRERAAASGLLGRTGAGADGALPGSSRPRGRAARARCALGDGGGRAGRSRRRRRDRRRAQGARFYRHAPPRPLLSGLPGALPPGSYRSGRGERRCDRGALALVRRACPQYVRSLRCPCAGRSVLGPRPRARPHSSARPLAGRGPGWCG